METVNWQEIIKADDIKGNIKIIREFKIPELSRLRDIWVYLPPDYETSDKRYPVLYMHDAQNLFTSVTSFSGKEWQIDESMENFFSEGKTEGVIIIGIEHGGTKRIDEMCPWIFRNFGFVGGGEGNQYAEFIVRYLKPYIDRNFRTLSDRKNTGIAGSSMGGLISLYMIFKYNDIFSKAGVFSPAFWTVEKKINEYIESMNINQDTKIYMDTGTNESGAKATAEDYIRVASAMHEILKSKLPEENIKFLIDEGAIHNEECWARRFVDAFEWLYLL